MSGRHYPPFMTAASEMLAVATISVALLGPALSPALAADAAPAGQPDIQAIGSHPVSTENAEDLSKLLPVLLTSAERKQLAADLEAFIRGGDLKAAENRLNSAIEMGTLAIVLVDRLNDPNLLSSLQAFGIRGGDQPAPASTGPAPEAGRGADVAACPAVTASDGPSLQELQQTLAREQERNNAVSRELAALMQDHRDLAERRQNEEASSAAAAAELQGELQKEKARSGTLAQELAALRQENGTLVERSRGDTNASAARIAELQEIVQKEQAQKASLTGDLTALREEHRTLAERHASDAASASQTISELRQNLQREQAQNGTLSQELAALKQEHLGLVERQKSDAGSSSSQVSELQVELQREQARSETSVRQLAKLQDEHRALQDVHARNIALVKSKVSELQEAWQQERERGDDVRRQLAKAQNEVRTLQSQAQNAAQEASRVAGLKDELAQAQTRGDTLARELADTVEKLHALEKAQEAKAQEIKAQEAKIQEAKSAPAPSGPAQTASVLQVLQPSPAADPVPPAAEAMKRTVASAAPGVDLGLGGIAPPVVQAPAGTAPAATANRVDLPPVSTRPEDRLLVRADELFRRGDISGARLLLERSMNAGHARAAFLLAETFDPHVLSRLGALGIRGDAAKARELYARARSLGIPQAQERIEALQ